jgi:Protein kinase domain
MEQMNGYDYKADIWSLGITALELAKGYAPYAKYPPMKVLILTIQEEPPSLASYDVETGFHSTDDEYDDPYMRIIETYSSDFEDFVGLCLQKDPTHRPTCTELLASRHFHDYPETRQRRMDTLRDEICAVVKDVGSKQEERAAASMALQQQQQTQIHGATTTPGVGGVGEDATIMAGNKPKSTSFIEQRVAEVEDRPAGTTWVFTTEESLSDAIRGSPGTERNDSSCHTMVHDGDGMSEQRTVRRRGSGHRLMMDGEYDDVLAELDEFERQTGGEHYDRQQRNMQQDTQQEDDHEVVVVDAAAAVMNQLLIETNDAAMPSLQQETNVEGGTNPVAAGAATTAAMAVEDDIDQFMDEFEQNTGGEDFRRLS